jgi:zinc transport system permease protein
MIENFLTISFLTIIFCTFACSMMGNLVLWKRISFYGDAVSHSALLGFTIGAFLEINQIIILIIFNLFFATLVNIFSKQKSFAIDSVVMILSYFFISCAVLFNENFNKNFVFEEFLFGDISAISNVHFSIIAILAILITIFIRLNLKKFLISLLNQDIAIVKNIKTNLLNNLFMILLSFLIAFAVKVTGVFLITALMIIPCATARIFSKNPQEMIIKSVVLGVTISSFGFAFASSFGLSITPSIIFFHCFLFFISLLIKNIFYDKI